MQGCQDVSLERQPNALILSRQKMQSFQMKQARSMQMCNNIRNNQWCHLMLLAAKTGDILWYITPRIESEKSVAEESTVSHNF